MMWDKDVHGKQTAVKNRIRGNVPLLKLISNVALTGEPKEMKQETFSKIAKVDKNDISAMLDVVVHAYDYGVQIDLSLDSGLVRVSKL